MDMELYAAMPVEAPLEKLPAIKVEWYHQAKVLFMNGRGISEIAAIVEASEEDIKILALGLDLTGRSPDCWYYERKAIDTAAGKVWINKVIEEKGLIVESIVADGADILRTGLLKLKEAQAKGMLLTPKQLKEISGIIMDMDKIARLESGKATEIIQNAGLSPDKIREVILNDPFLRKPKDIPCEVVKK